jgi:hypothetical protein
MERQAEARRQFAAKLQVGVRLRAAQAVVEVGDMQHQAQFPALLRVLLGESAQEGYGVRTAGNGDGEAQAGFEQRRIERQRGSRFSG